MKVSCPNCNKVLQAPDEWAGKTVKCPGCKQSINLPAIEEEADDRAFDLSSLEAIESHGQVVSAEPGKRRKPMTLKEAQAAAAQQASGEQTESVDPQMRRCSRCGQTVRVEDLYGDIICRHCGNTISGLSLADDGVFPRDPRGQQKKAEVSFYEGFTGAFAYPLSVMGSLVFAVLAAFAAALLVMMLVSAVAGRMSREPISAETDFSLIGLIVTAIFAVKGLYFGAVCFQFILDTIRGTVSGVKKPARPKWNPSKFGPSASGYPILVAFYALMVLLAIRVSQGTLPTRSEHLLSLTQPGSLVFFAVILFILPMSLIGLAGGRPMEGVHPVRLFVSIKNVMGHYFFLFIILTLHAIVYVGAVSAVLGWAGPAIMQALGKGLVGALVGMVPGLIAWAVLVGVGFYFACSLGRIFGLFASTYSDRIDFRL